ncbi:MAG TPA: hypothetical protein VKA26_08625 [Ignavibacteriaceae bacterium]|nr:hypothetical protein [Ignavibacteriaceae bacterium]
MAYKTRLIKNNLTLTIFIIFITSILFPAKISAQLNEIDAKNMRFIYNGVVSKYLVNYVMQCFENALFVNKKLYNYDTDEKTTLLMYDINDFGNAGTGTVPRNHVVLSIAPLSYEYETAPANERINTTFNHELVHLVTLDQSTAGDRFFRTIFGGKVGESSDNPLTIIYAYLTDPRRSTPRWWKEGIAVFLETWMAGGIGRAQGGYDEMVFRTMVQENKPIYDLLGFESEGTETDFQVGANSYLYGTRFMNYLALKYSPEKLIRWTSRHEGSSAYFASDFNDVYGLSLSDAWDQWIEFEKYFQYKNLARLRENPITQYRALASRPLGGVSRAFYDSENHILYAAIDFPGQVAQLAKIDTWTGEIERLRDIKGAALYYVTSLSYDPNSGTLFYTTDNNDFRSLYSYDLKTGDSKQLLDEQRIGDLAFNQTDKSLWGIRHYSGKSTIVRMPYPYSEWNQIYTWPYGQDMYNIDLSHDGKTITGALAEINGQQLLIKMNVDSLMVQNFSFDTLFNFENTVPANFIFSDDDRYLYGTSYYSGVSNIYQYDFAKNNMEIMSNTETGFFRPMPVSTDSLLAFKYTTDGFLPIMLENKLVTNVNAINLMGQQVVENHPIVKKWIAPPPSVINTDTLTTGEGEYSVFNHFGIMSFYPVVQGYKDYFSYGLRFNLSDPIGFQSVDFTASYSPYKQLPENERLHLDFGYSYLNWKFRSTLNRADFYDLFGPTKSSRKGYSLGLTYHKNLIYDTPRIMEYSLYANYYGNLQTLPSYQNVSASYDKLINFGASYNYKHEEASLGAVDYEKGYNWDINLNTNVKRSSVYPHIHNDFDLGLALPINHSSIWFRSSIGYSYGDRYDPFANFYFGGFGNNYIDDKAEKRYREYYSFPGVELNEIGGTNFGKILVEWNLPPLRFTNFGIPSFFVNYIRASLFSTGLVTNVDSKSLRRSVLNLGAQLDFRIKMLYNLKLTFSVGYAAAIERNQRMTDEVMFSLKIL